MEVAEMIEIMQINVKDIIKRADLQQIRNFVFDNDPIEVHNLTYNERLAEGTTLMLKRLKSLCKDNEDELDDIMCEYTTAVLTYRDIFLEIGMKSGARLLLQLLFQDDYSPNSR